MNQFLRARENAEQRFLVLPNPGAKDEHYRFSAMQKWDDKKTAAPVAASFPEELEEGALLSLTGTAAKLLGRTDGIRLTALAEADDSVSSSDPFIDDKFAQMAAARWKNGAYLDIPAGKKITEPVRISSYSQGAESHWRHFFSLGANAEATVTLELAGDGESRLFTELLELNLAPGAKLHWVLLQRNGGATQAYQRHKILLGKGAELKITAVHLGGAKSQQRFDADLGEDSALEISAACRGDGEQHFDFWTDVIHSGSRSKSAMDFWFVNADKARSVFNGLIQVKKDAFDCEAVQKAKSLLLSTQASVNAIPKLIIQTDAVKCAHGASVATVHPEQLHYLQSRGIKKGEAEAMIVRGFTEPVLAKMPTERLYERAETLIAAKGGSR